MKRADETAGPAVGSLWQDMTEDGLFLILEKTDHVWSDNTLGIVICWHTGVISGMSRGSLVSNCTLVCLTDGVC